jgi:hypothetical protein
VDFLLLTGDTELVGAVRYVGGIFYLDSLDEFSRSDDTAPKSFTVPAA